MANITPGKFFKLAALLLTGVLIYSLVAGKKFSERDFVGQWQSSRTLTPLIIAANGEWEIKTPEGAVLQYGIWRYENQKIIWTIKQGNRITDDVNPVLSVAANEFQVREQDGKTTVFKRIN
jgi:hypothetical protein